MAKSIWTNLMLMSINIRMEDFCNAIYVYHLVLASPQRRIQTSKGFQFFFYYSYPVGLLQDRLKTRRWSGPGWLRSYEKLIWIESR